MKPGAQTALRTVTATLLLALGGGAYVADAQPQASPGTDPSAAAPDKEPWSLGAYGISGTLLYKNYSQFQKGFNDSQNFVNQGILDVQWAHKWTSWWSHKIVGEVREDDDHLVNGQSFQIPETSPQRSIFDVKEAVTTFRVGPVDLMFGKQFFAWGTADGFNPIDLINPYDYLDVIDNEKLAVFTAAGRLTLGASSLTFVVIPVFTPSRTPLDTSRWVPPPPSNAPPAVIDGRELPSRDLSNIQYATRLKTTIRGWDLAVSYFDGFDSTPVIKQGTAPVAPGLSISRFTPVYTRLNVPGFDFSTTWRKFEFHGEAAFRLVASNGRQDQMQGVWGLNYTWDTFELSWLEQILFIVEYAKTVNLSSGSGSNILGNSSLIASGLAFRNQAFTDSAWGRAIFRFTDKTQLNLSSAIDFSGPTNGYAQLKATHKLTDALQAEAGLDFFMGGTNTFWGRWRENDRFFFFMKYFF